MFTKNTLVYLLLITKIFVISVAAQENQEKLAEIRAKNQQILEINFQVQEVLNDGIIAFGIKDYDSAIEKFDEGIRLDPDYWGSAPTLLTNKAMTLRTVGVEKYNEAVKQNLNPVNASRQYFYDAVDSLKKASQILENNSELIPDSEKNNFEKYRFNVVKELAESFRLLVLTDKNKMSEAVEALKNYVSIEIDPIKKEKAVNDLKKLKTVGQK
jgi:tetratricopeptide (TPR) repeat protein